MKENSIKHQDEAKSETAPSSIYLIATKRLDSTQPDLRPGEPSVVNLAPEQVEEIHVDDYSLLLFSATRIEALSIEEMSRKFPEPSEQKAQSVMNRFLSVGLVHVTKEGKYYSNYPHEYINWGNYRYEADIEAAKDAKVFQLVRALFGVKSFWKNKFYFSIDAFFTPEQSEELREMFMQLKVKAKQYANENAKAGKIGTLKFRRLKFYDMAFGILMALCLSIVTIDSSFAKGGTGTDPVSYVPSRESELMSAGGSGNDPRMRKTVECLSDQDVRLLEAMIRGGGGNDPTDPPPMIQVTSKPNGAGGGGNDTGTKASYTEDSCKLDTLLDFVRKCRGISNQFCEDVRMQTIKTWRSLKNQSQGWDI